MRKFIDLTIDEFNRNKSFSLLFIGILTLMELGMIILLISRDTYSRTKETFTLTSFFQDSNLFIMILGAAMLGVCIFTLYSWFREWHLQGRHIYRLMLLPGSRIPIAWAKWASIILLTMTMMACQAIIMMVTDLICNATMENYLTFGFKNELLFHFHGINLIIPVNFLSFMACISLVSLVILIISNSQILFLSRQSSSLKMAIVRSTIYLIVTVLLILPWIYMMDQIVRGNDYDFAMVLLFSLIVMNAFHGGIMSWLASRQLSV